MPSPRIFARPFIRNHCNSRFGSRCAPGRIECPPSIGAGPGNLAIDRVSELADPIAASDAATQGLSRSHHTRCQRLLAAGDAPRSVPRLPRVIS